MANRTDTRARTVHGTNPQMLIDNIIRNKIYQNTYWKENLMGVNAEDIVDHAIKLKSIGGTFGPYRKPCKFQCILLKLLQIQPDKEIIYAFIENSNYKYVRALGCFYLRLIGTHEETYLTQEQLQIDFRKLVYKDHEGKYQIIHMDEYIDSQLSENVYFDIVQPRMKQREVCEDEGKLEQRISPLEEELEQLEEEENAQKSEISQEKEDQNMQKEDQNMQKDDIEEHSRDSSKKRDKKHRKDKKKKHRRRSEDSRSRSRSDEDRKKNKKWKKVVKNKHKKRRSRSRTPEKRNDIKDDNKPVDLSKLDKNSNEYWLALRKQIGV